MRKLLLLLPVLPIFSLFSARSGDNFWAPGGLILLTPQ